MKEFESKTDISIDNVLLATDFSPVSEGALSYAAAIAARYHSKLWVAHVIKRESFDLVDSERARMVIQESRDEATRRITQMLAPLQLGDRGKIVVAEGEIFEALIDIIEREGIQLVVLGTHGRRALKKLLLGSVAEEVFRMAPCPVLTVGPKTAPAPVAGGIRHVLYPLEFAPDRTQAAGYAVSLAERYDAKLTVMTVEEDMRASTNSSEELPQPIEQWIRDHVREESGLRQRIRFEAGYGPVTDSILDFAARESVDIIVMSVSRLDPVMASHVPKSGTAAELVSRAPCPVLTIRA
jgi:nucleotide-binding universal stress UspA family protein